MADEVPGRDRRLPIGLLLIQVGLAGAVGTGRIGPIRCGVQEAWLKRVEQQWFNGHAVPHSIRSLSRFHFWIGRL